MRFPTRQDVIQINRRQIETSHGTFISPDNIRNDNSLEWVLDAIRHPLFAVDMYPTVAEKAAVLAWTIINGHVFHDGNKRTGLIAALTFLDINDIAIEAEEPEFEKLTMAVARGESDKDAIAEFFRQHIRE